MSTPNEAAQEKRIQELGPNAPRLTPELIDSVISKVEYIILPDTLHTVCWITLKNGFIVTGEAACASPANFNYERGQEAAYNKARAKIWDLEGYLLKERLYQEAQKD